MLVTHSLEADKKRSLYSLISLFNATYNTFTHITLPLTVREYILG